MREALVRSRNLVSIRLLRATGIGPAMRHIGAFGFGPEAMPPNLTLALGTGQVTPLEMARGFAVFANGGWRVTPYLVQSVTDQLGKTVFAADPPLACPDCYDAAPAIRLRRGRRWMPTPRQPPRPKACRRTPRPRSRPKSGPTGHIGRERLRDDRHHDGRDPARHGAAGEGAWTERPRRQDRHHERPARRVVRRIQRGLAAAAWVGFDQERSLGETEEGGRTALPMWV